MIVLLLIFTLAIILIIIVRLLKARKSSNYKWFKITAVVFILFLLLLFPSLFIFDEFFFSKSKAVEVLAENGIELQNDFSFDSKGVTGIMDYILEFKISISEDDKEQIIQRLKKSEYIDLSEDCESCDLYSRVPKDLVNDTTLLVIYETSKMWNLERIYVLQNGYVRTSDFIQVTKNASKIYAERRE